MHRKNQTWPAMCDICLGIRMVLSVAKKIAAPWPDIDITGREVRTDHTGRMKRTDCRLDAETLLSGRSCLLLFSK